MWQSFLSSHSKPIKYTLILLCCIPCHLYAQNKPVKADSIIPIKGDVDKQLEKIKERKVNLHSDGVGNEPKKSHLIDSTTNNKYGDLLNDDSVLNIRYPIWIPAAQVVAANAFVWAIDRYILNADYARISTGTWNENLKKGWEWDNDRFGINFVGHPYSGTLSFNAGRANGYNYFQSFAFSFGGSLMWEYLGENTQPSYNDIINTPVSGAFLGEVLYRLSSNILDDRTKGFQRFSREVAAGLINPVRGLNRLIQGKSFRKTNKEVYQKEPLNISVYGGLRLVNDGANSNQMANVQFDYGNPFEKRKRKAFDFFKLRADFNFGVGRKILDNVTGYGILFGKNKQIGKLAMLVGGFQYYDYWDNKTFELGTIGFGAGVFSKWPISKTIDLYTNIHAAVVPFAGNSTQRGPDTTQVRDYNYGGGVEGKIESTLNIGKSVTASLVYYYYLIHTYVGLAGDNYIGILKPRITVRVYKSVNLGFEHFIYSSDHYVDDSPTTHSVKTEQKIFVMFYFEDKQRKGRYN